MARGKHAFLLVALNEIRVPERALAALRRR
jgi:hypothetical protein